ncbi:Zinc finger, RING-type, conserved site [Phytophthora cactorum]|nr:Zinc finger, RING-type, conserved site [Phytophthora cactorum]
MQRLVQRDKGAPVVREGDEDSDADDGGVEDDLSLELADAEQQLVQTTPAKLAPLPTALALESGPSKFRTSASYVNLHSYDPQSQKVGGYAETKIGGHKLDHKRPFYSDWQQQLHGPLKTAVFFSGSEHAAVPGPDVPVLCGSKARGSRILGRQNWWPSTGPRAVLESWPAVEASTGLRTGVGQTAATSSVPGSRTSSAAVTYEIAPNVTNLYDCSRCFRLRQSPRVQLCCGHPVCAKCVASRTIKHVEHHRTCFLECARCNDMVAVEAVVFTTTFYGWNLFQLAQSRSLRLSKKQQRSHRRHWQVLGNKEGFLRLCRLSLVDLYLQLKKTSTKKQNAVEEAKKLVAEMKQTSCYDGVAGLTKETVKAAVTIKKGSERWVKRMQGLQPPSKLLKFSFVRTLGVGNFAEVMLVENRKGQLTVLKESDKLPEAANEISILSRVRSPHVVQIQQYFIEEIGQDISRTLKWNIATVAI